VIVTNQPDVAKGLIAPETLSAMHARLALRLDPDAIEVCPHDQAAGCDCRKPKPGMLLRAAARLRIDLSRSFMIGDRMSDIEAGQTAGCRCIFVDRGYREGKPPPPFRIVKHFPAAVDMILNDLPT
jgi:D-glycero-D-manno-heptose 1,7-bisphosphate phosphatase